MAVRGSPHGDRWGRLLRRHRRLLAGLATGASILVLGLALQPAPPGTVDVVVAARDLAVGTRLEAGDLTTAAVPEGVLPPGTVADPAPLVGQLIGAAVSRGEAISAVRLVATEGTGAWSVPSGTAPVPVRFSDAGAAALLEAGQRIDVLAASSTGDALGTLSTVPVARLVAEAVLVLAVAAPADEDAGLFGAGSAEQGASPLVVLAASRAQALAIAGAEAGSRLSFTLAPTGPAP